MAHRLIPKVFPIREGENVDDVCNKIKALAALPFAVETITIAKTQIKAMVWESEREPLEGDVPVEEPGSLATLLHSIMVHEVEPAEEVPLNLDALAVVADMLIRSRAQGFAAIAWVVGDGVKFCNWLGIQPTPIRFLELPLIHHGELGGDKILLLCGKSAQHHPLQATMAIATTLVPKEEEKDASV